MERYRVNGDPKRCEPCVFLSSERDIPICNITALLIKAIAYREYCPTGVGPVAKLPARGAEMHEYIEKAQIRWRVEGEELNKALMGQ